MTTPAERYGLRTALFAVAVVLVAVPFALLTFQVVREGPLLSVDAGVARAVREWVLRRPPAFVTAVRLVSDLGRPPFLTLLAGVATLYLISRDRIRLALFLVTTSLVGGLVNTGVKLAVARPRPQLGAVLAEAAGNSFPSGHAMGSTTVYGALLLVFLPAVPRRGRRYALGGTIALVLAIAATRVLLGVHYLSDVVAGIVLGLAWLAASVAAFRAWRLERGRRATPVEEGLEPEAAADLTGG